MSGVWLTSQELADARLPGLPGTKRKLNELAAREGWEERRTRSGRALVRPREGRGGGREWHSDLLPPAARAELERRGMIRTARAADPAAGPTDPLVDEALAQLEAQPLRVRAEAARRLEAVHRVEELERQAGGGRGGRSGAVARAAAEAQIAASTLWGWLDAVRGWPRHAWLAALAPRAKGRPARIEVDAGLLAFFQDDWLRPSQPSYQSCYRRLRDYAARTGKPVPDARTMIRRLEELVPVYRRVLAREGVEALARMYPAQERDRSHFGALECLCADGHTWDVMVEWPDGTVDRPVSVAFQDLASNKIVGHRIGRSETAHLVMLALHDVARDFGLPDQVWLDNGRAFASKWLSGHTPTRYRFKVKESDPVGAFAQMGVQVHWVKPYSGQSKPIERAWRDFCDSISRHPAFQGAYTGNAPHAKPADYGSRAVPLAVFERVVARGIAEHNARSGRRTRACGGTLSFDEAFSASFASRIVARPSPAQLRMLLLQGDQITARAPDGSLLLGGNRFWNEALAAWIGRKLTVRFDPDRLQEPLAVYAPSGELICLAECLEAVGFDTAAAAKEHEKARRALVRTTKELDRLERQFTPADIAALLTDVDDEAPAPGPIQLPQPAARRLATGLARAPAAPAVADGIDDLLDHFVRTSARPAHLQLVHSGDPGSLPGG
jgi:putative transposase